MCCRRVWSHKRSQTEGKLSLQVRTCRRNMSPQQPCGHMAYSQVNSGARILWPGPDPAASHNGCDEASLPQMVALTVPSPRGLNRPAWLSRCGKTLPAKQQPHKCNSMHQHAPADAVECEVPTLWSSWRPSVRSLVSASGSLAQKEGCARGSRKRWALSKWVRSALKMKVRRARKCSEACVLGLLARRSKAARLEALAYVVQENLDKKAATFSGRSQLGWGRHWPARLPEAATIAGNTTCQAMCATASCQEHLNAHDTAVS